MRGFMNERGNPYSAASINSMLCVTAPEEIISTIPIWFVTGLIWA